MKFNTSTRELFTDEDVLIKKLNCPYRMNWDNLERIEGKAKARSCSNCNHAIIDTSFFSDNEMQAMLQQNPDTCLKIDIRQTNITVITNVAL